MPVPFPSLAQSSILDGAWSFFERFGSGAYRPGIVLIELLLIGSVVYVILRFLQRTRGARLVRAVLMILTISFLLVQLVAHQLELDRINVLYPYFLQAVFLVSLVAFQAELRRMLMHIGETLWFSSWSKQSERMIDPLVAAVTRLSNSRIGALVAIERGSQLGTVVDSGVPMDAVITAELIETLFWPGTPLHDLGVVIRQGRIIAAGCQFPLIDLEDVERTLGSRHRAAISLSHDSDACVVVVSEETGIVSISIQGRLERGLSPKDLRNRLRDLLLSEKASRSGRESGTESDDGQSSQAA